MGRSGASQARYDERLRDQGRGMQSIAVKDLWQTVLQARGALAGQLSG